LEEYGKMEGVIKSLQELWETRAYYLKAEEFSSTVGYGKVGEFDLTMLNIFLANAEKYYVHLECFELLSSFKEDVTAILKVFKLSELLSSTTLAPEHIEQMKSLIKPHGKTIKT
jgi:hypothetical protein